MVISIAMLGFGVSGTLLQTLEPALKTRADRWLAALWLTVGPLTALCYGAWSRINFSPPQILQTPGQMLALVMVYGVLILPFIAASSILGLIFVTRREAISGLYGADLAGSAAGVVCALIAMWWVSPPALISLVVVLFSLGWWMGRPEGARGGAAWGIGLYLASAAGVWHVAPSMSEYKGLSYGLTIPEARVVATRHSPYGELTVVESSVERSAPGLSDRTPVEVLPAVQYGLYVDGNKIDTVVKAGGREAGRYMAYQLASLPYHVKLFDRVLLLGLGGGNRVAAARYFGARRVTVVEMNPAIVDLLLGDLADYTGGLLKAPGVQVVRDEARGFVVRHQADAYELIELNTLDASGLSFASAGSISTNYLLTVEALRDDYRALAPEGVLAINIRLTDPDRTGIKLLPIMDGALRASGLRPEEISRQVAFVRGTFYGLLLVKKGAWTAEERRRLVAKAEDLNFDISYLSGFTGGNRFLILEPEVYAECARALWNAGEASSFMDQYPFHLDAPTDDRPFFSHSWKGAPTIQVLKNQATDPDQWYKEVPPDLWAYPLLWITLIQATVLGVILLAVPWMMAPVPSGPVSLWRVGGVFGGLGVGYLLVEMMLIDKLSFFLGDPVISASLVLASMLVCSGAGSVVSAKWSAEPEKGLTRLLGILVILFGVEAMVLHLAGPALLGRSLGWRIAGCVLLIAPPAFLMGFPFPLGLHWMGRVAPTAVPWAWGLNGAASVVAVVLSSLVNIHAGFTATFLIAMGCYGLAWACIAFTKK